MAFKNWQEYLKERGTMVEKPSVEKVPDYKGPDAKAPEKAAGAQSVEPKDGKVKPQTMFSDAGNKAPAKLQVVKDPKSLNRSEAKGTEPYKPAAAAKPVMKGKDNGGGFANKGNKKLVVKVKDTNTPHKGKVIGEYPKKTPKSKTESFLDATKDMSMSEFTQYMLKECGAGVDVEQTDDDLPTVTAYKTGKFQPHPPEVIRYIVALAKTNQRIMENLIHEIKRAGGMDSMLDSAMDHPEFYDAAVAGLGDEELGAPRSRALVRAMDDKYQGFLKDQEDMYEAVAPPFGIDPDETGEEEAPGQEDDQQGTEGDDQGDEEAPEVDDSNAPDHPDDAPEGEDAPPAEGEGEQDQPEEQPEQPKKLKKRFAHHHVIDAMKDYDHMRDHMKGSL